jgi:hypothetical protein
MTTLEHAITYSLQCEQDLYQAKRTMKQDPTLDNRLQVRQADIKLGQALAAVNQIRTGS